MGQAGRRAVGLRAGGVRGAAVAAVIAVTAGGGLAVSGPGLARAAAATPICTSKAHPKLAARISRGIEQALAGRDSVVGLAANDGANGLRCALNERGHFDSASAIKATIISALLLKIGGPSHLTSKQRSLAWAMITQSSNAAATTLWDETGMPALQRFLNRAGMTHTELDNQAWGLSQLTASDELTLLKLLTNSGTVLSTASRRYVLYLMAHVEAGERWGVSAGAAAGITVHLKNGWLGYPSNADWHINSIGAFTGKKILYQMAILTSGNPNMDYGIATVQGAARVINRNIGDFHPAG